MSNIELKQEEKLALWERVTLMLEKKGKTSGFISRVMDLAGNSITLEMPVRQSGRLNLEKGDTVEITYNRQDAAYAFKASIFDLFDASNDSIRAEKATETRKMQRRRYVRLDVSGKMIFHVISTPDGKMIGPGIEKEGSLLNISAGGVLYESNSKAKPGSIVTLTFALKGNHFLQNILGVIKRCERVGPKSFLIGAELISKENYAQYGLEKLSDFLPQGTGTFDENLQKLIVRFIYEQQMKQQREKGPRR